MRQGDVKNDITEKRKEETKRERHKREREGIQTNDEEQKEKVIISKKRRKCLEQIFPVRNKEKQGINKRKEDSSKEITFFLLCILNIYRHSLTLRTVKLENVAIRRKLNMK
jgi:hypothetical protein